MSLKIERKAVVSMFEEMGMEMASKWPAKRMEDKIQELKTMEKDDKLPASKEGIALLTSILKAVESKSKIKISGFGEVKEEKPKKAAKEDEGSDVEEASDVEEKPKKEKKVKKEKEKKGPGVIASIFEFLQEATEDKPISKKTLGDKLSKRFTDRDEDGMMKTVNVQVPTRIGNDKGVTVHKNSGGYWVGSKPTREEEPKPKKKTPKKEEKNEKSDKKKKKDKE